MPKLYPKLYKVTLAGLHSSFDRDYGTTYVLAKDPSDAYNKVKQFLDEMDYGYEKDRVLHTIEFLADTDIDSPSRHLMFI